MAQRVSTWFFTIISFNFKGEHPTGFQFFIGHLILFPAAIFLITLLASADQKIYLGSLLITALIAVGVLWLALVSRRGRSMLFAFAMFIPVYGLVMWFMLWA